MKKYVPLKIEKYVPLFPIEERSMRDILTVVEFFIKGGKLYVYVEDEVYHFKDYIRNKDNIKFLKNIYEELKKQYRNLMQAVFTQTKTSNWLESLLVFIQLHFSLLDKEPDIMIGPNFTVSFNLER